MTSTAQRDYSICLSCPACGAIYICICFVINEFLVIISATAFHVFEPGIDRYDVLRNTQPTVNGGVGHLGRIMLIGVFVFQYDGWLRSIQAKGLYDRHFSSLMVMPNIRGLP